MEDMVYIRCDIPILFKVIRCSSESSLPPDITDTRHSGAENMANLANVREELERNLHSLVDAQHVELRSLIHETLACENIQDTVFYDLVLRRPRAALTFFHAALERQGRAPPIIEPSGNILQAFLRNFAATFQHQSIAGYTDELTASFRVYLGQLQRRHVAVPANLQRLVVEQGVDRPAATIIEELEFMSFFENAIGGNHATIRDLSWESQSAYAVFIRDTLAGRETPIKLVEPRDGQAVLKLRAEVVRLVTAGLIPALDQLVANFRRQRAGPAVTPAHFPGFQPTAPSQGESPLPLSDDGVEVLDTVFWPDVEAFLNTRAGSRPRCFCFCSAELFIPSLTTGGDASRHSDKEPMLRLPCDHLVGRECMRAWQEKSSRCPYCHRTI